MKSNDEIVVKKEEFNVLGYARVSTVDQSLDLQIEEITKFCNYRNYKIVRLFNDKLSGKNTNRVEYQEMIDMISGKNIHNIKAIIVTKLDRLGRSLSDLIKIVEFLKSKNIDLVVIRDNIDTTSNNGVLFFHLIGAISEFERKLIVERTSAGIKHARETGVKFGRPKLIIPPNIMTEIKRELSIGVPKSKICKKYKIKRTTLYLKLAEEGIV